ncbi:MAG: AMP-binding protein, partial [Acidobacteria bacterium]|nr:AMP-binding protein [Acidobacteriota bacterium]
GSPMPFHEVRIVDAENRDVGERVQGRLLFRGLSMTAGYYRNPQATAAAITPDGWMDSGDLAYWAGGELYITGRVKDCIIKSGRNIIPQEVEAAASEVPGVRRGCVAAFGIADSNTGTERLVVVAETRATRDEELRRIEAGIIQSVDAVLGIPPDKVQLVAPQSIPKTSSGKIRRFETRDLFLSGTLYARQRPPWLQIVRLALASAGSWVRLSLRRAGEWLRRAYTLSLLFLTAAIVRLVPSARVFGWGARFFLWAARYDADVHGAEGLSGKPCVLVANHPGRLDPVVLAAVLPCPVWFADTAGLEALPAAVSSLLRPLVVGLGPGPAAKQRIRQALEKGRSVLVFPEGRLGEPAHRNRFRLDAFHAAVETSTAVYPIALVGTSHLLASHPALRKKPKILIGEPIQPDPAGHREMVRLRDAVREAIVRSAQ